MIRDFLIVGCLILAGCAGGDSHSSGMVPVDSGAEFVVPELAIRLCPVNRPLQGDDWLQCAPLETGTLEGRAVHPRWVYVPAWKRPDGRIEVDFRILGHEVWHLVNWQYPDLACDPDVED